MSVEKYYWMRYAAERATNVTIKSSTAKIAKGDLFGVRELRGKQEDEVLLSDGTKFRLSIQKSDVLMGKSKVYKGKPPTKAPTVVRSPVKLKAPVKTPAKKLVKSIVKKPSAKKVITSPVKLSSVEMPDVDDFTDYDIPHEFKHLMSESSSRFGYLSLLSLSKTELDGVDGDSVLDFNKIIRTTIEPHVKEAKASLNKAIVAAASKIKAWAMTHLIQARKLNRRTDLFEKMVNNPEASAKQLALSMLGIKEQAVPVVTKEQKQLDDLLDGLVL